MLASRNANRYIRVIARPSGNCRFGASMHNTGENPAPVSANGDRPWWRELNRYHWFVFVVASLGWLFDTMDQQLFNIARRPAMSELLKDKVGGMDPAEFDGMVADYSGYATSIFLIGWATGGIICGILGDRIGRAKTML